MNLFNGNMLVASLTVENDQTGAYTSGSITASQVGATVDIHKSTVAGVSLPVHVQPKPRAIRCNNEARDPRRRAASRFGSKTGVRGCFLRGGA